MPDFAALRDAMVDRQIAGRGIRSAPLLAAMRKVPRELFVPEAIRDFAYEDGPLPIEAGQTISQPYIAILAAASGRHVPEVLRRQLKVGGALVMPIGAPGGLQNLVRITRQAEEAWDQYDLGPVRFVPLIGEEGWKE